MHELRCLFALMVASHRKYVDPSKAVEILKEAFTSGTSVSGSSDSQQVVSDSYFYLFIFYFLSCNFFICQKLTSEIFELLNFRMSVNFSTSCSSGWKMRLRRSKLARICHLPGYFSGCFSFVCCHIICTVSHYKLTSFTNCL